MIENLTYLNYHGVYFRQCLVFAIHIEINPHSRIVWQWI